MAPDGAKDVTQGSGGRTATAAAAAAADPSGASRPSTVSQWLHNSGGSKGHAPAVEQAPKKPGSGRGHRGQGARDVRGQGGWDAEPAGGLGAAADPSASGANAADSPTASNTLPKSAEAVLPAGDAPERGKAPRKQHGSGSGGRGASGRGAPPRDQAHARATVGTESPAAPGTTTDAGLKASSGEADSASLPKGGKGRGVHALPAGDSSLFSVAGSGAKHAPTQRSTENAWLPMTRADAPVHRTTPMDANEKSSSSGDGASAGRLDQRACTASPTMLFGSFAQGAGVGGSMSAGEPQMTAALPATTAEPAPAPVEGGGGKPTCAASANALPHSAPQPSVGYSTAEQAQAQDVMAQLQMVMGQPTASAAPASGPGANAAWAVSQPAGTSAAWPHAVSASTTVAAEGILPEAGPGSAADAPGQGVSAPLDAAFPGGPAVADPREEGGRADLPGAGPDCAAPAPGPEHGPPGADPRDQMDVAFAMDGSQIQGACAPAVPVLQGPAMPPGFEMYASQAMGVAAAAPHMAPPALPLNMGGGVVQQPPAQPGAKGKGARSKESKAPRASGADKGAPGALPNTPLAPPVTHPSPPHSLRRLGARRPRPGQANMPAASSASPVHSQMAGAHAQVRPATVPVGRGHLLRASCPLPSQAFYPQGAVQPVYYGNGHSFVQPYGQVPPYSPTAVNGIQFAQPGMQFAPQAAVGAYPQGGKHFGGPPAKQHYGEYPVAAAARAYPYGGHYAPPSQSMASSVPGAGSMAHMGMNNFHNAAFDPAYGQGIPRSGCASFDGLSAEYHQPAAVYMQGAQAGMYQAGAANGVPSL